MAPQLTTIVIDNGSVDATVECARAHGARVIANLKNSGFAAAVNQGIGAADEEFLLLLNPDVNLLTPVDQLVEASRRFGIAAGRLVDLNGRAQAGFTIRRFPTAAALIFELLGLNRLLPWNPVNRRYRYLDRELDQAGEVEQPAGAFLMIRRDVWAELHGFDERFYPIWFEDVDFCRRAKDAGYRIEYVPAVYASHEGAHSIRQMEAGCRAWTWCASLLRYAAKHLSGAGYRGVCAAMLLSSAPRMLAGMIRERSLTPVVVHSKIAKFAGLCLMSPKRRGSGEVPAS